MTASAAISPRDIWIRLLLYPSHTLPTAAAPVLVGIAAAVHDRIFAPVPVLIAFMASWLIHVGGVFTDNYELLRRHPDVSEHPELNEALRTGVLTFPVLKAAILACFGLAALTVPYLFGIGGAAALVIGVIGALSSYCYAGGPQPYVKHGLADPVFFAMFGIVAVVGTYYIQFAAVQMGSGLDALRQLPRDIWLLGLPVGALVVNVMVIDDIRDRHFDSIKGWRTPAVRYGLVGSRFEYVTLSAFAYAAPFVFWLGLDYSAWTLLPLATLPLAWNVGKAVCTLHTTPELLRMTPRAAWLSLAYSLLLATGIALPAL